MMVDCGNTKDFQPVDFLIDKKLLTYDSQLKKHILSNLTLTNYDQDHYSGLPYLITKAKISSVEFPKNLTSSEIKQSKPVITKAVDEVTNILDTYTQDVTNYDPPFTKSCYYLKQDDFPGEKIETNKLSQLVFVTYNGTKICIPGDLTSPAWDKLLKNRNIRTELQATNIFVASHHGREDGYNESIFTYCKPEVIVLSDKDIVHQTQVGQTQLYGSHVKGNGITLNNILRKTLTTRSDGHLWIRVEDNGSRTYRNF